MIIYDIEYLQCSLCHDNIYDIYIYVHIVCMYVCMYVCIYIYIIYIQKIRHYGPHIYSIAVFHVFRLFEILTNIRRAHDVVIFMCIFITRIHVRIPIHVHKQQWLSRIFVSTVDMAIEQEA